MLTIQNISRRMQVYNLDHGSFQEAGGEHGYKLIHTVVVQHDRRSGAMSAKRIPRSVCSSLTFAAGETRSELPDAILECDGIKAAIERRELRVLLQTADEPKPKPKEEPKAEEEDDDVEVTLTQERE